MSAQQLTLDFHQLAAWVADGLPPRIIGGLEDEVHAACEDARVHCLFLNTGCLQTREDGPVPHSGDLAFLGLRAEAPTVQRLLEQLLGRCFSADEAPHASLSEVPVEEFFDQYGFAMEMIEEQRTPAPSPPPLPVQIAPQPSPPLPRKRPWWKFGRG